jgi:hypothetical protein
MLISPSHLIISHPKPPAQGYARGSYRAQSIPFGRHDLALRANDRNRRMDDLPQGQESSATIQLPSAIFGLIGPAFITYHMYKCAQLGQSSTEDPLPRLQNAVQSFDGKLKGTKDNYTHTHTDSPFPITPTHLSLTRTQQLQASHHPTQHLPMATTLHIPRVPSRIAPSSSHGPELTRED